MDGRGHPGVVAVVGHVEWVTHAVGSHPGRGLIADLADPLEEPGGGGGVAAAAAARIGAEVTLFTAIGDDERALRSRETLESRGIAVQAARRTAPQTPVLSITEDDGERTIMVVGDRLQPLASDALDWAAIGRAGAAYYTGEDPGSLREARRASALVVTGRRLGDVAAAGVTADVIVASAADPDEDPSGLPRSLAPAATVLTEGERGGVVIARDGARWRFDPTPPPGPVVDSYGCGDSFAAGLAVGLARGLPMRDAVRIGADAGAACTTWRGGIGPLR